LNGCVGTHQGLLVLNKFKIHKKSRKKKRKKEKEKEKKKKREREKKKRKKKKQTCITASFMTT
jgi:hypothetical protein